MQSHQTIGKIASVVSFFAMIAFSVNITLAQAPPPPPPPPGPGATTGPAGAAPQACIDNGCTIMVCNGGFQDGLCFISQAECVSAGCETDSGTCSSCATTGGTTAGSCSTDCTACTGMNGTPTCLSQSPRCVLNLNGTGCIAATTGGTTQQQPTQQQTGQMGTIPEPSVTSFGDFYIALKAIAQWLLVFGIILGVIFIIIGAISVVTSRGDSSRLTAGKQTITWAVVGVILLTLAYAIVNIIARFFGASGSVITP